MAPGDEKREEEVNEEEEEVRREVRRELETGDIKHSSHDCLSYTQNGIYSALGKRDANHPSFSSLPPSFYHNSIRCQAYFISLFLKY